LRSVIAAAVVGLTVAATGPAGAEATDPGLAQQWGLRQIGAPTAWETSVGTGVPIAIIDTGIDLDHEDLRGQLMARVTCVGTGGDARRCAVDGADIHGHGTHVAGIAVAASNNAGVVGVAPGARLVAVRVFQEERSTDALSGKETVSYFADSRDIDAGIRWVLANVSQKGAINLSLSNELPVKVIDTGFEDGIEQAWAAGWVPVLSAGNESNLAGVNGEEYGDLNAMVVGATGPDGSVASYSSPLGSA
jgi:subtilisin family serine protease